MAHWLRQYTVSLVVGVFIIMIVGIVAHAPKGNTGATGFVVYGGDEVKVSGNTYVQKFIVKDCEFTPKEVDVAPGDRIKATFVVYDPSGRTHRIAISGLDVDVRVRGPDVVTADFIVPGGKYAVEDAYPCKAMGYTAKAVIVAK